MHCPYSGSGLENRGVEEAGFDHELAPDVGVEVRGDFGAGARAEEVEAVKVVVGREAVCFWRTP